MRRAVIVRTVINGLTVDGTTKDAMQQAVRDARIGVRKQKQPWRSGPSTNMC